MEYLYCRRNFREGQLASKSYAVGHEYGSVDGSPFDSDLIDKFKGETLESLVEQVRQSQKHPTLSSLPKDLSLKNLDSIRTVTKIRSGIREIYMIRPLDVDEMNIFTAEWSRA